MFLRLGEPGQAVRHRGGLGQLAELDERLDEVGRDRERARIVDPLVDRVPPDAAEAGSRALGVAGVERGQSLRPEPVEDVPALPERLAAGNHLVRQLPRLHGQPATAATSDRQRS